MPEPTRTKRRPHAAPPAGITRLSVFAFLWACQALVHQDFYARWLPQQDPRGWLLTILATGLLLFPRSTRLLAAMLLSSIAYNVAKWPFVVNHILVESLLDLTLLSALAWSWMEARWTRGARGDWRERTIERFAPVARTALVIVYYFAFLAKLNRDFLDPEVSCAAVMYGQLAQDRFPWLPTGEAARYAAIWLTLLVELVIPVALTFRRTWHVGILCGMAFHATLALVGHRTFSALAFAMYSLFLIEPLTAACSHAFQAARERWGARRWRAALWGGRVVAVAVIAGLIAAEVLGYSHWGIGPLRVYQLRWLIWGIWSLLLAAVYVYAMRLERRPADRRPASSKAAARPPAARPGCLWALVVVVLLNGSCQYLGLKTQTSFTMYSNLRTEGGVNNHLFLPALRLANYQNDLVEIVATDHPVLRAYPEQDLGLTYFELRRIVSTTDEDFELTYLRNGQLHQYRRHHGQASDPELSRRHPRWLAKLLYFRPIDHQEKNRCRH